MMIDVERGFDWELAEGWGRVTTVDANTAGESLRVILTGYPALAGAPIIERRRCAQQHHDALRDGFILR